MKKKDDVKLQKLVVKLASYGLTYKEIADALGYNGDTLKYNFKDFLIKGRANLKQRLKSKQIQVALGGNVSMLIWLGKQYLDQKDKMEESGEYNINVTRPLLEDKLKEEKENAKR